MQAKPHLEVSIMSHRITKMSIMIAKLDIMFNPWVCSPICETEKI